MKLFDLSESLLILSQGYNLDLPTAKVNKKIQHFLTPTRPLVPCSVKFTSPGARICQDGPAAVLKIGALLKSA
jgi:hypothetical protein